MPATAETDNTTIVRVVSNPVIHDAAGAATDPANATSPACLICILLVLCIVVKS